MKKFDEDYRDKQDFLQKLNENYDEIVPINSGGGGIIYKGIHRRLKQKVVLKKIRADRISIIGSEREMQILMNLKHTYLPRILDFWSYEDEVYTVMEFIEGRSFQELLQEGRVFTEKEVMKWTRQLAEVLEYLHNSPEHIIHSDIKPANLMLTPQNNICLIDFNVSVLQGGEDETIGYSPSYSPVEQLIQKELGNRKRQKNRAPETITPVYDNPTKADDDRTVIEDDRTEVDDDRTMIDDDRTMIDDDRTEVDDDRTMIDDHTEVDDSRCSQVRQTVATKQAKPTKKAVSGAVVSSRPSVDELVKKFGSKLQVDERSDIYSACATMYHILTGKRPAPCYEKQTHIEDLMPSVNDAFSYILMRGLEQLPKKRFQNATQLLTAMKQLMKSTKRYKRLLWKQDLAILFLVLLFLVSAGAAYMGFGLRVEEELTAKLETAAEYFAKGQYEDTVLYLEENVLDHQLYQESSQLSQGYYLAATGYLELEQYEEALTEYRKAILLDSSKPEYYRDYGIALARTGNLEQARECLTQASAKGLEDDSILLLRGEIAALGNDYGAAVNYLQECFNTSKDDYVKLSAGLKLDGVLEAGYEEAAYPDRIALLEMLSKEVSEDKKLMVWERMVQVYGDYGQLTEQPQYTEEAVKILDQILESGYATLVEWLDKAVFLQRLGKFEEARESLLKADKLYAENYLIYKRLAFLEMDVQAALNHSSRDYKTFDEYVKKCDEYYRKGNRTEVDMEMEYLYQVYDEVVVKGWLK